MLNRQVIKQTFGTLYQKFSKRQRDESFMLLMSICATTYFASQVLLNPYSRFLNAMPGITGVFYRSLLVTSVLITVWIYKYGWVRATIMSYTYYGLGNLMFNVMFFGAYDQNFITDSGYSNEVWTIRVIIMVSSIAMIIFYKLYRFTYASAALGLFYLGFTLLMIYVLPISWLSGEGNIPLRPLPQLIEFISIALSATWAYHFLRWRSK